MSELWKTPLFSILLCMVAFEIGVYIHKKTEIAVLNPILLAICLVIVGIKILSIPIEVFEEHTKLINVFLGPATVVLAMPMYSQRKILKENLVPILVATSVGAVTAIMSVVGLSYLVGLDEMLIRSFVPKSVTTPIAMSVAGNLGGIPSLAVGAVIVTGITGAVIAPALIKLFKLKEPVAIGLAIGASSHAVGTSKAVELGEVQGAMSGLAIGITGIFTVLLSLFM